MELANEKTLEELKTNRDPVYICCLIYSDRKPAFVINESENGLLLYIYGVP